MPLLALLAEMPRPCARVCVCLCTAVDLETSPPSTWQLLFITTAHHFGTGRPESQPAAAQPHSRAPVPQISYGIVPPPNSAYMIPPACHVDGGTASCCTSQLCQCEGVTATCDVVTDYEFAWIDIIGDAASSSTTVHIGDAEHPWEQNADDGWCEPTPSLSVAARPLCPPGGV